MRKHLGTLMLVIVASALAVSATGGNEIAQYYRGYQSTDTSQDTEEEFIGQSSFEWLAGAGAEGQYAVDSDANIASVTIDQGYEALLVEVSYSSFLDTGIFVDIYTPQGAHYGQVSGSGYISFYLHEAALGTWDFEITPDGVSTLITGKVEITAT